MLLRTPSTVYGRNVRSGTRRGDQEDIGHPASRRADYSPVGSIFTTVFLKELHQV